MRSLTQSFARGFYKVAFVILRLYWFIFRPHTKSVLAFLLFGNGSQTEILLIRHTYDNRGWLLPGGSIHRGEASIDAMRRELFEELQIKPNDLKKVGSLLQREEYRWSHTDYYAAHVTSRDFTIDNIEIAEARWVPFKEYSEKHADIAAMVGVV